MPFLGVLNHSEGVLHIVHASCGAGRARVLAARHGAAAPAERGQLPPSAPLTTNFPLFGSSFSIKPFSYVGLRCGEHTNWFSSLQPSTSAPSAQPNRAPHITMVGLDSVSWLQYERYFARTDAVLREGEVVDFRALNVLGDGTLKCLGPLLVGQDFGDDRPCVFDKCAGNHSLNELPWLPVEMRERAGYLSGWSSDFLSTLDRRNIFRLRLNGFRGAHPFDHTADAFFLQNKFPFGSSRRGDDRLCIGQHTAAGHHLTFVDALLARADSLNRPAFAVVHSGEGHTEDREKAALVDAQLAQFLTRLLVDSGGNTEQRKRRGHIVFIYGDHGPRYGHQRLLSTGFLEERLPLLKVVLLGPAAGDQRRLLARRSQQLLTFYDVHETLRELAGLPPHPLRRGLSLFKQRAGTPSCASLGIEPQWCTCNMWEPGDGGDAAAVQRAAHAVVDLLNRATGNGTGPCAQLHLHGVLSAQHTKDLLLVQLTTGYTMNFEAIVSPTSHNVLSVSRTSRYAHQQVCKHKFPEQFCLCKQWKDSKQ